MRPHTPRALVLGTTAALVVVQAVGAAAFILWVPQHGLDPPTPVAWAGASALALVVAGTLGWLALQLAHAAASAHEPGGARPLSSLAAVVATPLIVVDVVVALGMLPRLYHGPGVGLLVAVLALSAVGLVWSAREGRSLRAA